MKVLFLTEGTTIPSSRFRVGQFLEHFRAHGVECVVRAGYGDAYNRIAHSEWSQTYKLGCRLKRSLHVLEAFGYDAVFLQRPALPFTALPEQVLASFNPRIILDYDDNLTIDGHGETNPIRHRRLRDAAASAKHVIVGNSFLATLIDPREDIDLIPTVIDTDLYTPGESEFRDPNHLTIGWMGTSSNFKYIRNIWPFLKAALEAHPKARFRVISNADVPFLNEHPQVAQIRWTAKTEIAHLRAFDIGLMPLEPSLAAKGKCGFKMIQYMAVGIPVIVSDIGANGDIYEGSGAGFLALEREDWAAGLKEMMETSATKLGEMGASGRAHVETSFSITGVLPRYLSIFERVASSR